MPQIRVFSSDHIELKPCHMERANNLVRSNKAFFFTLDDSEIIVVIKKCSKQVSEQVLKQEDKPV